MSHLILNLIEFTFEVEFGILGVFGLVAVHRLLEGLDAVLA